MRRPASPSPLVADYLATFDEQFALSNMGDRATRHGMIELTGAEARNFEDIERRQFALYAEIHALASIIGPYTPCPCNSSKKVKWCHGA